VLCGSALDAAGFATLMGEHRAAMAFTDPPYNVRIDGHASGLGAIHHRPFPMASGEMDRPEFTAFLGEAFRNLVSFSVDGSLHFVCMDWRHLEELLAAGRNAYSELKNLCIWVKHGCGMGSLYRSQHETRGTERQATAAIRHLFDWLVTGQVVPINPAASVRGPRYVVTCGQTPVLDPAEARALLYSIDVATHAGLCDRALIGLMVYSFARIGAALGMAVEDVFTQNRRLWVRLREKGGKQHAMPCHHNLEEYLTAYLDGEGLRGDPKGAAVPHDRPRHRPADSHDAPAGERLCDDPPVRCGSRNRHQARQPQLSRNRDHRLSQEPRHTRKGRRDGEPCLDAHDAALRSPAGRSEPR
jgi:site-specific recombinase XerC